MSSFSIVTEGVADPAQRGRKRVLLGLPEQSPRDAHSEVERRSEQPLATSAPGYVLNDEFATAINLALCVRAPLLITGEPGTGKTQVAYWLAWLFDLKLERFQARSTSTADDLRYDFDAVAYLHHAQVEKEHRTRSHFVKKNALWRAYESKEPAILLIDEIDKAPRDFPNDLLRELDEHRFQHPFEDRVIEPQSKRPPIVVCTSNAERRLPDAFLRRCVVHHIKLDEQFVRSIVRTRAKGFPGLQDEDYRTRAVERFFELRSVHGLSRKPSTSELLTWLAALAAQDQPPSLEGPLHSLPLRQALVKDERDAERLEKKARG